MDDSIQTILNQRPPFDGSALCESLVEAALRVPLGNTSKHAVMFAQCAQLFDAGDAQGDYATSVNDFQRALHTMALIQIIAASAAPTLLDKHLKRQRRTVDTSQLENITEFALYDAMLEIAESFKEAPSYLETPKALRQWLEKYENLKTIAPAITAAMALELQKLGVAQNPDAAPPKAFP